MVLLGGKFIAKLRNTYSSWVSQLQSEVVLRRIQNFAFGNIIPFQILPFIRQVLRSPMRGSVLTNLRLGR